MIKLNLGDMRSSFCVSWTCSLRYVRRNVEYREDDDVVMRSTRADRDFVPIREVGLAQPSAIAGDGVRLSFNEQYIEHFHRRRHLSVSCALVRPLHRRPGSLVVCVG